MEQLSLNEFVQRYGPTLFARAERQFPPMVVQAALPERPGGRKALGAQALAATALARALREQGRGFLVGEMSTGKTKMALDALLAFDAKGRFLVLCPPHLVEKWAREAQLEGFEAVILESPAAVRGLSGRKGPLVAILSRERAKLGPGWGPGVAWRRRKLGREVRTLPTCPRCGQVLFDREGLVLSRDDLERKKQRCSRCQEPLWNVRAPARVALGDYLKRRLPRGYFQALILDEAHEYKAGESAQGIVAGTLANWVGRVLVLTGTLFGGYASNLYHLFERFLPGFREEYRQGGLARFVSEYGLLERIESRKLEEDGRVSRRRKPSVTTKERPGLSPLLLPRLLPYTAFVRLREVAEALPPYRERVQMVAMGGEHRERVLRFYEALSGAMRVALRRGSRRLLGGYLQGALHGPDAPFAPVEVRDPETGGVVARLEVLPESYRHPKEEELLRLVQQELARGRRVLVYVQNTGAIDQIARLEGVLRQEGVRARGLYSDTVSPREREAWLEQTLREGTEVVLTHPRLVQTGLDLVGFPTLVFYQTEYSVYTLRQAARRSWRIGQRQPVQVVFLAYQETLQASALALIATKARSSLALEGELVEGGLSALSEEDPTLVLAQALAGTVKLEWEGEIGLEDLEVGLPTLQEPRWVRVGRRKVLLPAGQPVLFGVMA